MPGSERWMSEPLGPGGPLLEKRRLDFITSSGRGLTLMLAWHWRTQCRKRLTPPQTNALTRPTANRLVVSEPRQAEPVPAGRQKAARCAGTGIASPPIPPVQPWPRPIGAHPRQLLRCPLRPSLTLPGQSLVPTWSEPENTLSLGGTADARPCAASEHPPDRSCDQSCGQGEDG